MNQAQIEQKIRNHWTTYLPKKVQALKAEGFLNEEIQGTAKLALAEFESLKAKGYQEHEAEEVVLSQFVYLKPEPGADVDEEQAEELAAMDREYRANPPWQATMHDQEERE